MAIAKDLAVGTGMPEGLVRKLIERAPTRYKTYEIPKKNGGMRVVSQPAREVKALQRSLIDILLRRLPVHRAAMAYRIGLSIRDNAQLHAGSGPILKMDFKDFFPSITDEDWDKYCRDTGCLSDEEDIRLTSLLLFKKVKYSQHKRLAIGAPSSPILSNILMFEFDRQVSTEVAKDKVSYSRYADDLTFSAPRTGHFSNVVKTIYKIIRRIDYPKLWVNAEKTTFITPMYKRSVTGLVLTNDGEVSIGHDRKRHIRAMVHHALTKPYSADDLSHLAGMLAFAKSAEPEFFARLQKHYGVDMIDKIVRTGSKHD